MTVLPKLVGVAAAAIGVAAARRANRRSEEPAPQQELTPEDCAHLEAWVFEEVKRLRALSYEDLLRYLGKDLHCEGLTPSGAYVVRETSVFWDDPDARTLRVIVDAFHPRSPGLVPSLVPDSFIRAPDGSFIDE